MNAIIVTNCTSRKRIKPGKSLEAPSQLEGESVEKYARRWIEYAQTHSVQVVPEDLYCSRGYGEAIRAAQKLGADIYTVSAGFGLLTNQHTIPPYNFTLTDLYKITDTLDDWWRAINLARESRDILTEIIMDESIDLALISISTSYMRLIETELLNLPERALKKLRLVIGYEPPTSLEKFAIKYDSRLDGPNSPIRGTRADFNSRALHHFVENVVLKTNDHSIENHKDFANALLEPMIPLSAPKRQKATDEEIKALIEKNWRESGGRSGSALRLLRDKAGVACEQGRFSKLFRQVMAAQ
ncbi:DUF6884 domain-containing protein [Methylophaga pinxianii]|uniref:DUF6884 domain-containing protein n=1 Tax=Methylophaga pinxianii TaxID=2881052 RepID=UPI001CF184FE|nr:DUF6884 domain-containing protein [Methylophaga pinxianii]MCB2427119.1 hypothetical protein [Methylophaga pinxianii]UPH44978.1 hypothetical protein LGT42_010700 [Methylophaga pinxianii]